MRDKGNGKWEKKWKRSSGQEGRRSAEEEVTGPLVGKRERGEIQQPGYPILSQFKVSMIQQGK